MRDKLNMTVTLGMWARMKLHRAYGVSMHKVVALVIESLNVDKLSRITDWSKLRANVRHEKNVSIRLSSAHAAKLAELKSIGVPVGAMIRFELNPILGTEPGFLVAHKPELLASTHLKRLEIEKRRRERLELRMAEKSDLVREREEEFARALGVTWEELDANRAKVPSNQELMEREKRVISAQPNRKLRSKSRSAKFKAIVDRPLPPGYLSATEAAAQISRDPDWKPPVETEETLAQRRLKSLLAGRGDPLDPRAPVNRLLPDFLGGLEAMDPDRALDTCCVIGHPDTMTSGELEDAIRAAGYDPGKGRPRKIKERMLAILGPRRSPNPNGELDPRFLRRMQIEHEMNLAAGLVPPTLDLDNLWKRGIEPKTSIDEPGEIEVEVAAEPQQVDPFEGIPDE